MLDIISHNEGIDPISYHISVTAFAQNIISHLPFILQIRQHLVINRQFRKNTEKK